MRDVLWTDEARREYLDALRYLAPRNPTAAERLRALVERTVADLAERPSGRPGRIKDTYEKVLHRQPYIIAYTIRDTPDGGRIVLLGFIHTSRNWTSERWPDDT